MNVAPSKQNLTPPLKGVFPLDHSRECTPLKDLYLHCLRSVPLADKSKGAHSSVCKEASKAYITCRMEKDLMQAEELTHLGFGPDTKPDGADKATAAARPEAQTTVDKEGEKEKEGFTAGKHLKQGRDGWLW